MKHEVDNIDIFPARLAEALGQAHAFNISLQRDGIVSAATLKKYLEGTRIPDALILAKLASYLEVSSDYLLGLSSVMELPARWMPIGEEFRCSHCENKGKQYYKFCPTCGKEMNTYYGNY